jgi:hypothetical protein
MGKALNILWTFVRFEGGDPRRGITGTPVAVPVEQVEKMGMKSGVQAVNITRSELDEKLKGNLKLATAILRTKFHLNAQEGVAHQRIQNLFVFRLNPVEAQNVSITDDDIAVAEAYLAGTK